MASFVRLLPVLAACLFIVYFIVLLTGNKSDDDDSNNDSKFTHAHSSPLPYEKISGKDQLLYRTERRRVMPNIIW